MTPARRGRWSRQGQQCFSGLKRVPAPGWSLSLSLVHACSNLVRVPTQGRGHAGHGGVRGGPLLSECWLSSALCQVRRQVSLRCIAWFCCGRSVPGVFPLDGPPGWGVGRRGKPARGDGLTAQLLHSHRCWGSFACLPLPSRRPRTPILKVPDDGPVSPPCGGSLLVGPMPPAPCLGVPEGMSLPCRSATWRFTVSVSATS